MNRLKFLKVFAFSLLILGLPALASAQWRDRDHDDDYYRTQRDRRGGYYNQGALRSAVERLKKRSREFERRLDRELDRSRYNNRREEDRLNDLARDFRRAADRLEDKFDGGRNLNKSYDEARRVLSLGRQLENALSRARLGYNVRGEWDRIRQDLNTIAAAYNYGNYDRRRSGGWRNNFPFPF